MPYKNEDDEVSETGNWNVSKSYSMLKIMKQLYAADDYATIAEFGNSELLGELQNPYPPDYLKIKGFKRLVHTLILIIDNSIFAVRKNKDELENYRKELARIQKVINLLFEIKKSQRTRTSQLKIINDKYNPVLQRVLEIKSLINTPLNKNDLIFVDREEFDPVAYKSQVIKQATTRG